MRLIYRYCLCCFTDPKFCDLLDVSLTHPLEPLGPPELLSEPLTRLSDTIRHWPSVFI